MKNNKITDFSFVCAALVVQLHIGLLGAVELSFGGKLIREIVTHGLCQIAVPFFFVVSGYFLSRHFDEVGWYRRELFKRLRSLAVPYLFWSIVVTAAIFMALLCLRDLPCYDEILQVAPCGIARWQRFPTVKDLVWNPAVVSQGAAFDRCSCGCQFGVSCGVWNRCGSNRYLFVRSFRILSDRKHCPWQVPCPLFPEGRLLHQRRPDVNLKPD